MTDDDVTPSLTADGSRREFIRRSAVVGGALVWAVPTVQAIGPRAFAQDGSPGTPGEDPCVFYAVKINLDEREVDDFEIRFNQNSPGGGGSACLIEEVGPANPDDSGVGFVDYEATGSTGNWTQVVVTIGPFVDTNQAYYAEAKAGDGCLDPVSSVPNPADGTVTFTFQSGGSGEGLSNIQLYFCARPV